MLLQLLPPSEVRVRHHLAAARREPRSGQRAEREPLEPIGFSPYFLLEQIPFLTQSIRGILRQHSNFGGGISKAVADARPKPVDGGANEGV